jgi:hypothetical protein
MDRGAAELMRKARLVIDLGLVVLAGAMAVLPLSPDGVESWFSIWWYPRVQHLLTPLSNGVPVALFDAIVSALGVIAIVIVVRGVGAARTTRRIAPVLIALRRLLVGAAALYLLFLATWGLNYRRIPMADRLVVRPGAPASERVVMLGLDAVARMNALHDAAHAGGWQEDPWASERLREAFATTQRALSDAPPAVPGRLKRTALGPYFRWTGVDGMVDPFALEVLANPDLLPWERPFVTAHEWAHLAGYADESEANFVGWLTCLRADAAAQYSGWLYLYWQINAEVSAADRARLAAVLGDGVKRDLAAIVERLRRGQLPLLRTASWAVYDQYLKANRVEEGIRSYGAVITLILQARFDGDWTPVRRDAAPRAPGS